MVRTPAAEGNFFAAIQTDKRIRIVEQNAKGRYEWTRGPTDAGQEPWPLGRSREEAGSASPFVLFRVLHG